MNGTSISSVMAEKNTPVVVVFNVLIVLVVISLVSAFKINALQRQLRHLCC
jgi:uncharacterized membrane protein